MTDLSWTPIQNVNRYCSPACGRGCTKPEYDSAKRRGRALAARLGKGWTPRVWENLGWHYSARSKCGRLEVYAYSATSFGASLGGGRFTGGGYTPKAAVSAAVAAGRGAAEALAELVEGL